MESDIVETYSIKEKILNNKIIKNVEKKKIFCFNNKHNKFNKKILYNNKIKKIIYEKFN